MKLNRYTDSQGSHAQSENNFNRMVMRLRQIIPLLLVIFILGISSGCDSISPLLSSPTESFSINLSPEAAEPTAIPVSDITFRVEIPTNSPTGQPVTLNLLDEVTGLALNARAYLMDQEDDQHYTLTLPFAMGSVIKYRYSRQGEVAPVEEHLSDGRQLRYRMYHVEGPGSVQDVVTRWTDTQFEGGTGRISGAALNAITGQPIPNILIVAGGAQTLTTSDGSYLLEGLVPGTHNLVAYALDATYRTFQQGATVAVDSTTPAELRLNLAPLVNVSFEVTLPDNTIPAVPIRLAGNLYQLGNTFADLSGGVSTLAMRMPTLNVLPDQKYTLDLILPAGADVRYLYTLGDGLWNLELNDTGKTQVRQIIIPEEDITVQDTVENWTSEQTTRLVFDIQAPANTPPNDYLSIQFKPFYGWTETIPMWSLGDNRWAYVLNATTNWLTGLQYRVCRNDQCGSADDLRTMGLNGSGYAIEPEQTGQTNTQEIAEWAWLDDTTIPYEPIPVEISLRGLDFIAGIEYQPDYHPSWTPLTNRSLNDILYTGANWLFLTPTWSYTRNNPPVIEQVTGRDPLWVDVNFVVEKSHDNGLNVALYPMPNFPGEAEDWWLEAKRDFSWWVVWFERYRSFILHHADLAELGKAQSLVIGGDWLAPALPGGTLADGTTSGVPEDAATRWQRLIQDVRSRYSGTLVWAISDAQLANNPPPFIDAFDLVYLEFSTPLATYSEPSIAELESEAARILDSQILPFKETLGKPLVLGVVYPSADGSSLGCLADPNGEGCLSWESLSQPNPDNPYLTLDLGEQADIYEALLRAVNARDWIDGFVSRGYYPPTQLRDKSASIHGKPAGEVLRYWYPRLTGLSTE